MRSVLSDIRRTAEAAHAQARLIRAACAVTREAAQREIELSRRSRGAADADGSPTPRPPPTLPAQTPTTHEADA